MQFHHQFKNNFIKCYINVNYGDDDDDAMIISHSAIHV